MCKDGGDGGIGAMLAGLMGLMGGAAVSVTEVFDSPDKEDLIILSHGMNPMASISQGEDGTVTLLVIVADGSGMGKSTNPPQAFPKGILRDHSKADFFIDVALRMCVNNMGWEKVLFAAKGGTASPEQTMGPGVPVTAGLRAERIH